MDDFEQDDSEGNGFSQKTCSENNSCYTKFINSNRGVQGVWVKVGLKWKWKFKPVVIL